MQNLVTASLPFPLYADLYTDPSSAFDPHAYSPTTDAMVSDNREYELIIRQQPKQARMCGVGGKADRRPIDPPPIIQLNVIDRGSSRCSSPDGSPHHSQSFLQNPYYFMYASLASPDRDEELHLLKDGKTRCTTGSVVSSLYHLKDTEQDGRDAGFFVFPDLSVRTEGSYRLKLTLFEVVGATVHHCKSIFTRPFYVFTAKKFPGMEESTNLSCALADQGIKIRIRKDIRVRKSRVPLTQFQPLPLDQQPPEHFTHTHLPLPHTAITAQELEEMHSEGGDMDDPNGRHGVNRNARDPKRQRVDDGSGPGMDEGGASGNPGAIPPPVAPANQWGIDPNMAPQHSQPGVGEHPQYAADPRYPPQHLPYPPHHSAPIQQEYHHPHYPQHPPQHPGPGGPPPHHASHPPNGPPPPPNGPYPSYEQPANGNGWGPPSSQPGYSAYHPHVMTYEHQPQQHQRAPPPQSAPASHYGPPSQPLPYTTPPPPYYYGQHNQYHHGHPQPSQPVGVGPTASIPGPSVPPAPSSPHGNGQAPHPLGRTPSKDPYAHLPPPSLPGGVPIYPSAQPAQEYSGYNRGPPPPPPPSQPDPRVAPPAPPQQPPQSRQYQPYGAGPPGPGPSPGSSTSAPQQHMNHYPPHPGHSTYSYQPAPADPYAPWTGQQYPGGPTNQPYPPPQAAQHPPQGQMQPPPGPVSPYGRGHLQTQQWSPTAPGPSGPQSAGPASASSMTGGVVPGAYGFNRTSSPPPQTSPMDGYPSSLGGNAPDHRNSYGPMSGGGYGRSSMDEGRRSPPAPGISNQGRHPSYSSNMMGGNGNDRIQLAPLRGSNTSPILTAASSGSYQQMPLHRSSSGYGSLGLERTGSGNAKKNPLSIGSIISEEKN